MEVEVKIIEKVGQNYYSIGLVGSTNKINNVIEINPRLLEFTNVCFLTFEPTAIELRGA